MQIDLLKDNKRHILIYKKCIEIELTSDKIKIKGHQLRVKYRRVTCKANLLSERTIFKGNFASNLQNIAEMPLVDKL